LGLKLVNQYQTHWPEIQALGLTIGLHPAGDHGPEPGNSESLAIGFTVDNLDYDMTAFKDKAIVFSPNITEDGPVRIALYTASVGTLYIFAKSLKITNKNNMKYIESTLCQL
jgi:hypothetical protein